MSKLIVLETFLKCPNCGKFKNANYTKKTIIIKAVCFCGTILTKLNNNNKTK